MGHQLRVLLYHLNVSALLLVTAGLAFSAFMLVSHSGARLKWGIAAAVCALIDVVLAVLHILRRSKMPAAGEDFR